MKLSALEGDEGEAEQQVMEDENDTAAVSCREIAEKLFAEIMSQSQRPGPPLFSGKLLAKLNCVCKLWCNSFTATAFLSHHFRSSQPICPDFYVFCRSNPKPVPEMENLALESQYKGRSVDCTLKLFSFQIDNDNDNNNYTSTRIVKGMPVPFPKLPRALESSFVTVSNFCDGLVCVYNCYDYSPRNLPAFLCSVRIQDFFPLPTTSLCPSTSSVWTRHWCSLGFDPKRWEYRALRSISREEETSGKHYREYEILTVGSKSWKLIDNANVPSSITQGLPSVSNESFCLNGVIYWLHCKCFGDYIIASLDLAQEDFQALSVNQLRGHSCYIDDLYYLAPLNGHPTLFSPKTGYTANEVLLWQWTLLGDGNSNPVCSKRIITSHIDSRISWGEYYTYQGGTMIIKKLYSEPLRYCCFDLENGDSWVMEIEERCEVLRIG